MTIETVDVVAAVIRKDDKFLLCQRNLEKRHGGLWEFPGGKVLSNESFPEAINREIMEELAVEVSHVGPIIYSASDGSSPFIIHFMEAIIDGIPVPTEHHTIEWLPIRAISDMPLAPADNDFFLNYLSQRAEGSA